MMSFTDRIILFVIIILNLLVRLPELGHSSFDLDEAIHVWYAQKSLPEIIGRAAEDPNPPLFNILISFWIKVFGVNEAPVRWFSLLFSAFAGGALFYFIQRNFTLRMALMASAMFLVSATQLKYAHNARPYAMMMFLMVCSYGMLIGSLLRPAPWRAVLYGLCTALMLYAHPTTLFNLPAQGLLILFFLRKDLLAALGPLTGLFAAFGMYVLWHLSIPYFKGNAGTWLPVPGMNELMDAIRFLNCTPDNKIFLIQLAVTALGIASLLLAAPRRASLPILLGLLWTVMPALSNFLYSQVATPVFQAKYILSAHVGMTVLLAASLDAVRWWWLRWAALAVVLWHTGQRMHWQVTSGEDWRTAASIVMQGEGPDVATFLSPWYMMQPFAYHYDRDIYRDHTDTQGGLIRRRVFTAWHDIVPHGAGDSDFRRVHFIDAQPAMRTQARLIDSLMAHTTLVAEHRLEGINILTFDLRENPPLFQLEFGEGELPEGSWEYSPGIVFPLDSAFSGPATLNVTADLRSDEGFNEVFLVASFAKDDGHLFYEQKTIGEDSRGVGGWHPVSIHMTYDPAVHGASDLKTFVWNPSKRPVRMRDLKVRAVTR